jgi:hypothetical protein
MLPVGTLATWNGGFDDKMKPLRVADKRGRSGKVTIEIVRQVVEKAGELKLRSRRLRIKDFTRMINEELKLNLSRKTVQDILIANDLHKAEVRRKKPRFYQNLCRRIPNGLLSLDGSDLIVWVDEDPHKFNVELGVDVGSFCHTGFGITRTETGEAVIEVLERHQKDWGVPLGVLIDHGSANLSDRVAAYLKKHRIEPVPAGPANPKGNGTGEGAFSQMKRVLGVIRIDTSTPEALARCVLEKLISVYVTMRNQNPLHRNGVIPRMQMQSPVSDEDRQTERERVIHHKQVKNAKEDHQPKIDRLHWIIKHHELNPEPPNLRRAEYCIRYYEMEAIAKSEEAFLKAVSRDSTRRNLPYFFGTLRNIQQQIDNDRYQEYCRKRYNHEIMLERQRQEQAQQQLHAPPTIELLVTMGAKAVTQSVQFVKELARRKCEQWTRELLKSVQYIGPLKKQIVDAIGSLKDLDEKQKQQVWRLIERFLDPKSNGECVTFVS